MTGGTVVIIVVAIVASAVIRLARIRNGTDRWHGLRQGRGRNAPQALLDPAQPSPREKELQREVEDLRERIHVLERIATDGRHTNNLAAEIESLRDR
jgi:hypothetical protein